METDSGCLTGNSDRSLNSAIKVTAEEPTSKRHKSMSNSVAMDKNGKTKSPTAPVDMTMEQYALLKYELHQRKIFLNVSFVHLSFFFVTMSCVIFNLLLQRLPRVRVRDDGLKAVLDTPFENRIPLFMKDIQHMLAYFLFGPYLKPYNSSPR